MGSLNPLLLLILSFVTFVVSGPLHPNAHSSRLAKPISSRQFHYPRALVDLCAEIELSQLLVGVVGSNLGLSGDICLCLSAFPLDLQADADLQLLANTLGETKAERYLKNHVEDSGTQCTYPDHASPQCTFGNVCAFACTDGFVKNSGSCACSSPNKVCNGKCGPYPNGCSSALPMAPKMTRRSPISSRNRATLDPRPRDLLTVDFDLKALLCHALGIAPADSSIDIDTLLSQWLASFGVVVPILGVQSTDLTVNLSINPLVDQWAQIANTFLLTLLGIPIDVNINSSNSTLADPNTISLDFQFCGLPDVSFQSTLTNDLKVVTNHLNGILTNVTIVTSCTFGGSGCPTTPSTPVATPNPSNGPRPPSLTLGQSGIVDLGLVEKILADIGLGPVLDVPGTVQGLTIRLSVGQGDDLLDVVDTPTVVALVGQTLELLVGTNITLQTDPDPTVSLGSLVVSIDLSTLLSNTTDEIVDSVLLGVSAVLTDILNVSVVVNVDGGSGCGCSGSRTANPQS